MRDIESVTKSLAESSPGDLADQMVSDLNVPSPLMGADGPTDQLGPEESYIAAFDRSGDSERENFGDALRMILLEDASQLARNANVTRPLLLFNIFSMLDAVEVPAVIPVLNMFRDYEQPLRQALAERSDDLYAQLLLAHAVNQHASKQDIKFWLKLLNHNNVDYVSAGIVGLRESGWENAITYLPQVKQAHERHAELGPFDDEVMLTVDTYPTMNWPDCARDHVLDSEIMRMIQSHGTDRYHPEIDELEGPAAEIIKRAGKQEEVRQRRKNVTVTPALALASAGRNGQ